jgi:hypothetical protein
MFRIRLITALLSLVLFLIIAILVQRERLKPSYALVWIGLFGGMAVITLFPGFMEFIGRATGLYYLTALLFISIILLLVMLLHFASVISRLDSQNRALAERLAFLEQKMESIRPDGPTGNNQSKS